MITGDMTILEIIEKYPETRPVFDAYGARCGSCLCCVSLFETVAAVAARHGLALASLLADLNRAAGLDARRG